MTSVAPHPKEDDKKDGAEEQKLLGVTNMVGSGTPV